MRHALCWSTEIAAYPHTCPHSPGQLESAQYAHRIIQTLQSNLNHCIEQIHGVALLVLAGAAPSVCRSAPWSALILLFASASVKSRSMSSRSSMQCCDNGRKPLERCGLLHVPGRRG